MAQIPFLPQRSYQSPYLYLQAAGSRGTDGSVRGIYLRWDLTDKLGELHLPKGDLSITAPYTTAAGYNRPGDYVRIWRTCYTPYAGTELRLSLSSQKPALTRHIGNYYEWEYQGIELVPGNPATARKIILRFWNAALYNSLMGTWNPTASAAQAFGFLKSYTDFVEADLIGERAFRFAATMAYTSASAQLRLELVSRTKGNTPAASISLRKNYMLASPSGSVTEFGENISYVRWKGTGGVPDSLSFVLYEPYINAVNAASAWTFINNFSLSLNDPLVLNQRLQQTGVYGIDTWPHFNDGAQARFANFSDRWTRPDGLKAGVTSYLQNSTTASNLTASVTLPDDGNPDNNIQMSMIDSLRMAAIDFHVARMLGLGYIDRVEAAGKEAWCLSFINDGEHVLIKHHTAYASGLKQKFSAEIWIRPDVTPNYVSEKATSFAVSILEKQERGAGWQIKTAKGYNAAGQEELYVEVNAHGATTPEFVSFSCRLTGPLLWYQLVLTKNGPRITDWNLYINNSLNPNRVNNPASTTCDDVSNTAPLIVNGQKHLYKGYADALRVYKAPLTAAEINTLWTNGRCFKGSLPASMIGHWPFDEPQGVIAHDVSATVNPGNLISFPSPRTLLNGGAWIPAACCPTGRTRLVLTEVGAHLSVDFVKKKDEKITEGTFSTLFWLTLDPVAAYDKKKPEASLQTILQWYGPSLKAPDNEEKQGGIEIRATRGEANEKGAFDLFAEVILTDARTQQTFRFTSAHSINEEPMHVALRRGKHKTIDAWELLINGKPGKRKEYAEEGVTVSHIATTAPLRIGNLTDTNTFGLDNVQISGKKLSDEEITTIYKAGSEGTGKLPSEVGWWRLDETDGLIAKDSSENINDAKIAMLPVKAVPVTPIIITPWQPEAPCSKQGCADESSKYVYLSEYVTQKAIPDYAFNYTEQHFFMSLPTAMLDERLPASLSPDTVTYGLNLPSSGGPMPSVTDANGYSFYQDLRFINVNVLPYGEDAPFDELLLGILLQRATGFFDSSYNFSLAERSLPVCHGIDYRLNTESDWRKPELLHDPDYDNDTDGLGQPVREPRLIPVSDLLPLFLHQETEEGVHFYAPYNVNWFNRTKRGSAIATDFTKFIKRNRLLPPLNFAVQYVQKEDPLILTSQSEQDMLQDRIDASDPDPNFTRATFLWNQIHNTAYQYANEIEFWFRRDLPLAIQGQIVAVTALANNEFRVDTGAYTITSTSTPTVISPSIASGDEAKFIGSMLATDENEMYEVTGVINPGSNAPHPSFIIKGNFVQSVSPGSSGVYGAGGQLEYPDTLPRQFLLTENLQNENNWEYKLVKQVGIPAAVGGVALQTHTEDVYDDNGTPTTLHIGGIFNNATYQPMPGAPGVYTITFGFALAAPVDADVSWYKGTLRHSNNFSTYDQADVRDLEVWRITNLNPLTVIAYDADYTSHAAVMPSTVLPTNFHPGYRVYLDPEAGLFQGTNILPAPGSGTRTTYMAARSADTAEGNYSSFTTPVLLMGREIITPEPPEPPRGGKYATRADVYGKSTYTFDNKINVTNRTPYGFVFYRASDNILLSTLWENTTIDTILEGLASLEEPIYLNDYWIGLVNMELQSDQFKVYGTGQNTFSLPNPDRAPFNGSNITGSPSVQGTIAYNVRTALLRAFVSLTEQPVLYPYLKTGLVTDKKKPTILDANGNLLPPDLSITSPFDPYPMARKYVDGADTYVRFTDYTLDGALHGRIYFYYGIEIGQDWKKSQVAGVAGPVYILHVTPAKAPAVRRYTIVAHPQPDVILHEVGFEINPYADSEQMKKVVIYRAINQDDARSLATMTKLDPIDITDVLTDTFADLDYPPYEENLQYRLVALREIENEYGQPEYVPSEPSEPVVLRVSDSNKPVAPMPTATPATVTPTEFQNVTIEWTRCCYKGTYYLYRMTTSGQWQLFYETPDTGTTMQYNGPETASLARVDSEGNTIYSRFLLRVKNASGRISDNDATVLL